MLTTFKRNWLPISICMVAFAITANAIHQDNLRYAMREDVRHYN